MWVLVSSINEGIQESEKQESKRRGCLFSIREVRVLSQKINMRGYNMYWALLSFIGQKRTSGKNVLWDQLEYTREAR